MPGVIGASRFSPRLARGYRFHSLQVEIMTAAPSRHSTPQLFGPSAQPDATFLLHLCCDLNALLNCWFQVGASRIAQSAKNSSTMRRDWPRIMANVAVLPASSPVYRSRDCDRLAVLGPLLREEIPGRKIACFKK